MWNRSDDLIRILHMYSLFFFYFLVQIFSSGYDK